MAELEQVEQSYRRRIRALEHDLERLRQERDRQIRKAHEADVPIVEIAHMMKLSHQRISSIVRG